MLFKRKDIMYQALEDAKTIKTIMSKGVSVIGRGVKLQQFDERIEILNMGKGGDYFKECNEEEYEMFQIHGWRKGALLVGMNNCKHKLDIIEVRIKTELNTRKNDKHIQNLKNRRDTLVNKYANIKIEFNKL
tara:strand:+ start:3971 stop:4366 length:396 start_codon:yes stop_codon:yes gene_type:complete